MAEEAEIEDQVEEEEAPETTVKLGDAPDPRFEELGLNEFESLLMTEESQLINSEAPELEEGAELPEPEPSGIGAYGLQALGGVLDTIHNVGDMLSGGLEEENPELAKRVKNINTTSDHLVFNIKGFENYDPKKPTLFFMEANEWNKKHSEGTITHWPTTKKSDDTGQQLT